MKIEIRRVDMDEIQVVPPCRVLMENGKPVDYVVESRTRRRETYPVPMSHSKGVYLPHTVAVGRPKEKIPPKRSPRGMAWARMRHVTADVISAMLSEGMRIREVATKLGCSDSLVYERLRLRRIEKSTPGES
jgi:hypothetical protein